ncbi:hypothetical protein LMG26411_07706 [Cupriavidus numazuensis]|uniref:Uncharacterized protein n=2 Tax=Cupriavidus numazuensis TaxID=221992 RepID=A0ABM8TVJ3_9BURK|nr:hypothetical protein LMG26411_07706 [Cupriavidus numazuensis]
MPLLNQPTTTGREAENGSFPASSFGLGHGDFLRKPLTMKLAAAVFGAPHLEWRLASAATLTSVFEGQNIARTLLQEGECFRQIVLMQRLMRFLFDLSARGTGGPASTEYGFTDRCSLENATHDQFCISPASLSEMLDPQGRRRREQQLDRYASLAPI